MSTSTAKASATVRKYGGITIMDGGNKASDSVVTAVPGIETMGYRSGVSGSKVPGPSSSAGTSRGLGSGTFAYQVAGKYCIRRVSDTINGTANTTLVSGCSDWGIRRPIHSATTRRSVKVTGWNVNWQRTGTTETNDSFGADHAATPTRAVPGELVYMETGATPTQDDYQAKTG